MNINRVSYLIHIANSNTQICTQNDSNTYSNSFDIAITQGTLNISRAELSIFSMTFIAHGHFSRFSIVNFKTISITCIDSISISFKDGIAEPRD